MTYWLNADDLQNTPTILVTVATVEGSGPRETGARMWVTENSQIDTIGGGHLELRACEIAREMLVAATRGNVSPRLERFALGPGLGQCCGGVVHLVFETMDQGALANIDRLRQFLQEHDECWRLVALDHVTPSALFDKSGHHIDGDTMLTPIEINFERPCHVMRDRSGRRWLVDPCKIYRPHLVLFGAGHVGAAIVRALAELPCRITWVDEREDMFPSTLPANVQVEATDTPEFFADNAANGSTFLVLTHSHTLDLRLSEHILRRSGDDWFGLIGSKTKRSQFEHRLTERGISRKKLDAMVCPIGIAGIAGKEPAVIAVAVIAQLLQVWEAAQRTAALDAQPQATSTMIASGG